MGKVRTPCQSASKIARNTRTTDNQESGCATLMVWIASTQTIAKATSFITLKTRGHTWRLRRASPGFSTWLEASKSKAVITNPSPPVRRDASTEQLQTSVVLIYVPRYEESVEMNKQTILWQKKTSNHQLLF